MHEKNEKSYLHKFFTQQILIYEFELHCHDKLQATI